MLVDIRSISLSGNLRLSSHSIPCERSIPVTFADGYSVGETAIAIGNSEGMGISVTKGIVSVDNEIIELDLEIQNILMEFKYFVIRLMLVIEDMLLENIQ